MADFKKLSEVATIEKVADTSCVLIEENGEIYRAPKTEVGGFGGKMLILVHSDYDDYIASEYTAPVEATTFTANMTLDEAISALKNRELIGAVVYFSKGHTGSPACMPATITDFTPLFGSDGLMIFTSYSGTLYWTTDGLSSETPGGTQ